MRPPRAVSFDFGQTLARLDAAMLARRLAERGVAASEAALEEATPAAWAEYDRLVLAGLSGHPWRELMSTLLRVAGVEAERAVELAAWLFEEQPKQNLWRRPIPGMIELCRDLDRAGVPIAVLSNSEGRLAELVDEIGWGDVLRVLVDSGRVGIEKPDSRIFRLTAERLGAPVEEVVHVGDSVGADVEGALAAGMRAVWFLERDNGPARALDPERVKTARDAAGVRRALRELGLRC